MYLGNCLTCKEDLGEEENKLASAKKEFFLSFSSALFAFRFFFFRSPREPVRRLTILLSPWLACVQPPPPLTGIIKDARERGKNSLAPRIILK